MSFSLVKRAVSGAALAAVVALGVSAPAQAAVYKGTWDPAFGAAYPDLGWKGEASFFIPDACLASAGLYTNGVGCGATEGGMKLLSADVSLYTLADPGTVIEVLSFDAESTGVFGILQMRVNASNKLSGVIGAFDYLRLSTAAGAAGVSSGTLFGLGFEDDAARLLAISPSYHISISDRLILDGKPNTFITFAPAIPEPSTYAMTLLGLAALGMFVRRRRGR